LVEQKHKGWDFAAAQSISREQNPSTDVERECCFIVCGYYTPHAENSPYRFCILSLKSYIPDK